VVDLTKPCVKCGNVDRYSNGDCKPCKKASVAKYGQSDEGRAKRREYCESDKVRENRNLTNPCGKCGEIDRYSNGRCKPCQKKSLAKYRQSDQVRAKQREYKRKQAQTAIGRQSQLAANAKYKKTLFEFSLQNQQKVIEQCQQKN